MKPVILILGGGTGGLMTAHFLHRKPGSNCRIIIFEKEEKNVFAPSLLWLMVGKRKVKDVYRSTRQITKKGIELVLGNIKKVDPENKSVFVNGKQYNGDYLIISLGAAQQAIPSLSEKGFDFFSLDGADRFNNALRNFKGGKIAVLISSLPFKCPAAPYEAAMLIESALRKKGLRDKAEISIYTPEIMPMPVAGKALADAVKQMLESKGIKYFPEHQFTQADSGSLHFSNGNSASFDLLAYTPKHICPDVIANSPLKGKSGWIETDRNKLIIDVLDIDTKKSLKQPDGSFLIEAKRWEQKTVLTVIGQEKANAVTAPYRNAWIYIDPATIGTHTLSKFAPDWDVNLPMSCRLVGDKVPGYENADITSLPMTISPLGNAKDANLQLQVMLTKGESVKGKAQEGMVGNYFERKIKLVVK